MSTTDWFFVIYGCACAALAVHYCRAFRRMCEVCTDLRQALRERDAAGREPERSAFQSGFRLGLQAQHADVHIEVECPCARCQARQSLAVN